VVLPLPAGPMMASRSQPWICRLMSFSTALPPKKALKDSAAILGRGGPPTWLSPDSDTRHATLAAKRRMLQYASRLISSTATTSTEAVAYAFGSDSPSRDRI